MPILIEQLNSIPCDVILTMGVHPTQAILQTKIKRFSDYVGKVFDITLGENTYKLIPIYNPSPLNPKGYKDNLPIFDSIKKLLYLSRSALTQLGHFFAYIFLLNRMINSRIPKL